MPSMSIPAINLTAGGKTTRNVGTLTGTVYTTFTGDPQGVTYGTLIDKITDAFGVDVNIDVDKGTVSIDRKSQPRET